MKYLFVFLLIGLVSCVDDSTGDAMKKQSDNTSQTIPQKRYRADLTSIKEDPKVVILKENKVPITGIIYDTYENGNLKFENSRKNGMADGKSKYWDENGNLLYEANYTEGKENGFLRIYANGRMMAESYANMGIKMSEKRWDETGLLRSEIIRKGDTWIQRCWNEEGNEIECD